MPASAIVLMAFLLAGQNPPSSFQVEWSGKPPYFRGVPLTLRLRALDPEDRLAADFEGTVRLEGVLRKGMPVEVSEPFRAGELTLAGVEVPSGKLVVRLRDVVVPTRGGQQRMLPGFLTLLPALLAILLAITTRQVLLALFCGVWVGAAILGASWNPLTSLLTTADTYVVGSLANTEHAYILLFSLTLAGLVGVITATGGVRGIVKVVSRAARGPRSGQVATWLLGLLIFFDDYANSLIVGNTMRPFADRVRISREKLSFIVDATAAPIATIGIISTWTAYQLGQIAEVLPQLPTTIKEPYSYFLGSIPCSFYSILTIVLVLLIAVSLRDFGPMRLAEQRCRQSGKVLRDGAQPLVDPTLDQLGDSPDIQPRWYNAAVPVGCVIVFTFAGLYATGLESLSPEERAGAGLHSIIGKADSFKALLWASLGASGVAGLMALGQRFSLSTVVNSWVSGARSLVLAAMILVLAWAISKVCANLGTGAYVVSMTEYHLSPAVVPALAFLTAGVIAFSTGTSYGTMAILIPIFLPLMYTLATNGGLDPIGADRLGQATLAAILGGSVFGDHCSPISDTTVLSSMAAGADHIDHVRTQLPYALLVAIVSVVCYLALGFGVPVAVVLCVGLFGLTGLFFLLTRNRHPADRVTPDG